MDMQSKLEHMGANDADILHVDENIWLNVTPRRGNRSEVLCPRTKGSAALALDVYFFCT
jgi:hypothetical protein